MNTIFENIDPDIVEQELARESAVRRLFALVRRRLRELQRDSSFSQQELAARMHVTPAQVSRWFANPSNMTIGSAAKILMAMGRKLELGMSDPFALSQLAEPPEVAAAAPAATGLVLNFSDYQRTKSPVPLHTADKRKMAMAAKSTSASGESHEAIELEPPVEFARIEAEAGEVLFLAWRSIVFVAFPGAGRATRLVLSDEQYDVLPTSAGFHIVGELPRSEVEMFVERHRENPALHPVVWN